MRLPPIRCCIQSSRFARSNERHGTTRPPSRHATGTSITRVPIRHQRVGLKTFLGKAKLAAVAVGKGLMPLFDPTELLNRRSRKYEGIREIAKTPGTLEERSSVRPTILHHRDQHMSADLCEPEKCFRRKIRNSGTPRPNMSDHWHQPIHLRLTGSFRSYSFTIDRVSTRCFTRAP